MRRGVVVGLALAAGAACSTSSAVSVEAVPAPTFDKGGGPPPAESGQPQPVPPCLPLQTCNATHTVPTVDPRACTWGTARAAGDLWCAMGAACIADVNGSSAIVVTRPSGQRDVWLYAAGQDQAALLEYFVEVDDRFFCIANGPGRVDVASCGTTSCVDIGPCALDLCAALDAGADASADAADAAGDAAADAPASD